MKRFLDHTGDVTEIYHDTANGCVIETRSNIASALIERNKRLRNSGSLMQGQGMRYVGSFDPVEFMRWCKEDPELIHEPERLYRKLHDPDYADFRVVDKRKL